MKIKRGKRDEKSTKVRKGNKIKIRTEKATRIKERIYVEDI